MDDTRRLVLAVAGLAILGLLSVAGVSHVLAPDAPIEASPPTSATSVSPVPDGGELWPYTSRSRGFAGRTLPINVIALADEATVRDAFRARAVANWTRRPHPQEPPNASAPIGDVLGEELVWSPAHGATRYSFVRSPGGTGRWMSESYQLYDGAYLGVRQHVRAYASPHADWTAMQAHAEYWDWFRLRHTVTSTAETQAILEDQFRDSRRVARVSRMELGNAESGDADGEVTVLHFGTLALLVIAGGRYSPARELLATVGQGRRLALLVPIVGGTYLGVCLGAIALEGQFPGISPKMIAGAFYPMLAVGLPLAAFRTARGLPIGAAFAVGSGSLAGAFLIEYVLLGLAIVPVELLFHRLAVVLSLGLLAAAGAEVGAPDRRRLLTLGVLGWVLSLGLPLLGLV